MSVPSTSKKSLGSGRWMRILGGALIVLALLIAIYGTVAYLAWQRGQEIRAETASKALQDALARQMELASENIDEANYALALRRLEWVATRNPDQPGLSELSQKARQGYDNQLVTPSPPAPSAPTATQIILSATPLPDQSFSDLEEMVEAGQWLEAITAIVSFQNRYPDFRRQDTDRMLYDANINRGLDLLNGSQVELGLFYLAQAEKLGDLPVDVEDQRSWAELYLEGISFFGVDWDAAVFYFRGLCAAAPFYQNSCDKLYQALVAYGNQYAAAGDWCPAQDLFEEALRINDNQSLSERLSEAQTMCLQATPTATVAISSTVTITDAP